MSKKDENVLSYMNLPDGTIIDNENKEVVNIRLIKPNGNPIDMIELAGSLSSAMMDPEMTDIHENWLLLAKILESTRIHFPDRHSPVSEMNEFFRGFMVGRLIGKFEKNTNTTSAIESRPPNPAEISMIQEHAITLQQMIMEQTADYPYKDEETNGNTSSNSNAECNCLGCQTNRDTSEATSDSSKIETKRTGTDASIRDNVQGCDREHRDGLSDDYDGLPTDNA